MDTDRISSTPHPSTKPLSEIVIHTHKMFSALIKRNSLYVATIFGGAFAFQAFFDSAITRWYEQHNKGKLWKDVKPRFLEGGDDEDEEE
ncbi:Cytochrome b-c1 complex subunit 9, mitochondrial [Candidozyma auris]